MRGLQAPDQASANIMGLANMVMQGVDQMEQRKYQQAEREWQEEQRDRERQQWQVEDDFNKLMGEVHGVGQQTRQQPDLQPTGPVTQAGLSPQGQDLHPLGPVTTSGLQQPQQQQPKGSPSLQELLPNTPGYSAEGPQGGVFKNIDLNQYDPRAVMAAREQIIDDQVNNLRHSREFMQTIATKGEMNRRNLQEKLARAIQLNNAGETRQAAEMAAEAMSSHAPTGEVYSINKDGTVHGKNFVTGKEADLGFNANDPAEVNRTLMELSAMSQDSGEFLSRYMANSQTQAEAKRDAILNPQVMVNDQGQRLYRVDMPNSDRLGTDTLFFDHPPTFDSQPLDAGQIDMSGFRTMDTAESEASIASTQALTRKRIRDDTRAEEEHGWDRLDRRTGADREPPARLDSREVYDALFHPDVGLPLDIRNSIPVPQRRELAAEAEAYLQQGMGVNQAVAEVLRKNEASIMRGVPEDKKEETGNWLSSFLSGAFSQNPEDTERRLGDLRFRSLPGAASQHPVGRVIDYGRQAFGLGLDSEMEEGERPPGGSFRGPVQQPEADRRVTRRGVDKETGRPVVQYDDGEIEYAD